MHYPPPIHIGLYNSLNKQTLRLYSPGTLQSDKVGDTFSNHRENILKTAKTLVEDTKTLVSGAAGSQDQLAAAAQSAVSTIGEFWEGGDDLIDRYHIDYR